MNIFYIDPDPARAAKGHVDRHVVKMILETAQLLSTAHHVLDGDGAIDGIYKSAYAKHPSAYWVRESAENYLWARALLGELLREYWHRYGRYHATSDKGIAEALLTLPKNIPHQPFTPPTQAMPDEYKHPDSLVAYRNYYRYGKAHLHKWTKRERPWWL